MTIQKTYRWILIVGSTVGLLASFLLTVDTIKIIENPQADIPCNINPFVSCANVATVWQGNIFGFPNSLLGIAAFSMLFTVGIMFFFGGRPQKPLWLLVNLSSLVAIIFVIWFFYQSVYKIGSLCIYCMVVWAVTWPIFLYTTIWNIKENHFSFKKICRNLDQFLQKNHLYVFGGWYLLIALLIFIKFRDFFLY